MRAELELVNLYPGTNTPNWKHIHFCHGNVKFLRTANRRLQTEILFTQLVQCRFGVYGLLQAPQVKIVGPNGHSYTKPWQSTIEGKCVRNKIQQQVAQHSYSTNARLNVLAAQNNVQSRL